MVCIRSTGTIAASCALVFLALTSVGMAQTLSFTGTPALGQNVTLITTGLPGATYTVAVSPNPGPTPFPPLGNLAIGMPIYILIGAGATPPFSPALGPSGQAADVLAIPINFSLYNQPFYFQAAYANPMAPFGLAFTNGISFTIGSALTAPVFSSITPTSGGASGGTPVTILGANFLPGPPTVTLGGSLLQNLQVIDAQTITGTTPIGTPGTTVGMVITTPGGTVSVGGAYSYLVETPTITSIVPAHAHVGGGEIITINGSGLGPGTTIYLAGYALTPLLQNAAQLVAFAPPVSQIGYADAAAVSAQGYHFYSQVFRYTMSLDTGTGAGGAFTPTSNTMLNTNANFGVFNFSSVNIPAGVTVTATGTYPLTIRSRGAVTIAGTLSVAGATGTGVPGPGGFQGGAPPNNPGNGPGGGNSTSGCGSCAAYGTLPYQFCNPLSNPVATTYGNPTLLPLIGGSGGASYYFYPSTQNGGGGGGAVLVAAGEEIVVSGTIDARGGDGSWGAIPPGVTGGTGSGSGGAIKLQSLGNVTVSGVATVAGGLNGGNPGGGDGRWYVEGWFGMPSYGVTPRIAAGIY